jgi:hypothetical protein
LLGGVIALYLLSSLALQGLYGPSFGFLQGEDAWIPDGQGGWEAHGNPSDPQPTSPSVNVPIGVRYIPIFLPGLLLAVFLFTPLGRKLDRRRVEPESEAEAAEAPGETGD